MRSSNGVDGVDPVMEQVTTGLDTLAAADAATLDDDVLAGRLLELVAVSNRVHGELLRLVDTFDRRALAGVDGFKTSKAWLQACADLSGPAAYRLVKSAQMLRGLPKLAAVAQAGEVSGEHLRHVARLVGQVGVEKVTDVDATLADAARMLDPDRFALVCTRVSAHLDPDGPDPGQAFEKRALTLSATGGMTTLRGQLDPEGAAALATALDAVMAPPVEGDTRSGAQRRADALVELARLPLAGGELPTVGGQRPQVGVLLYPQALSPQTLDKLAAAQRDGFTAARLRELVTNPDDAEPDAAAGSGVMAQPAEEEPGEPPPGAPARSGPDPTESGSVDSASEGVSAAARPMWSQPGWADPPWLHWHGPIPAVVAQRIACDADFFRIILDPASGMPLDVGRSHRLVPYWIRRALYARDRGCRWTGCHIPAPWTDAHHLDPWADNGQTSIDRCLLLCRHHHGLVHEGGWRIDLDPHTGEVTMTRPEGVPYALPRARSRSWNGTTTHAR